MNDHQPPNPPSQVPQTTPAACCDSVLLSACCGDDQKPECCGPSEAPTVCGCDASEDPEPRA